MNGPTRQLTSPVMVSSPIRKFWAGRSKRSGRLILSAVLFAFSIGSAVDSTRGQARFIQITDPHLFDRTEKDEELRTAWRRTTEFGNVKGLFAGHLHENRRSEYQKYPSAEYPKLHICPPLAVKLQPEDQPQARSFSEVLIDYGKGVTPGEGTFTETIYWYDSKSFGFEETSLTEDPSPAASSTPSPDGSEPNPGAKTSLDNFAKLSTILQLLVLIISAGLIVWQLKQQTSLARVANVQDLVALSSPFNLGLARDRDMAELWHRGHQGENFRDPAEREQYRTMIKWWMIFYENVYFQTQSGLLDKQIAEAWIIDIKRFVREHPVERYWDDLREKYYAGFVEFMDRLVKGKISQETND